MRRLSIALLVGVLGITAQPAIASAAEARAPVSPDLVAELDAKGTTKFMVYLRERANLAGAAKQATSDARATHVYQQLTGTAKSSQADLRTELDERKAPYRSFWIANALQVTGDQSTVDAIAARPDVERIEPSRSYPLLTPTAKTLPTKAPERGVAAAEWNVDKVRAPEVWSQYGTRGEGIVVATIDSGAQYDHPALVNQYRGNLGEGNFDHNYNWFDPAGVCGSPAPCDNEDHGTHVAGTAVGNDGGNNQIGVAPGAKWIAAKGCEDRNCTDASLLASGEWVLAPTDLNGGNPRPDLHADVVNNSWGGGQNDPWYRQTIAAWTAAGMFPSFAVGNAGPGCDTANSPGDEPGAYAVGGHDINNAIYGSSSRGVSAVDGSTKPDISAPAVNVRSSVPGNLYAAFNGTSMATPHVSGTVALLWSAAPTLKGKVEATRNVLDRTALDVDSTGCGGTAADNNNFGEGRLDAYAAVARAIRQVGEVTGVVTDAAGKPLAGATVSAADETATTAANGSYSLSLPIGEQRVTAALYGYRSESVTVTVPENGTVTANFDLDAATTVRIGGLVFDGSGHRWPLAARIDVAGRPGGPIFSDPATGLYSVGLAGGSTYRFTFTSLIPGYQTLTREVAVGEVNGKVDAVMRVDPGCTAPGYRASFAEPTMTESFDGTTAPPGWTVVNRTTTGGWQFDDPGNRGNLTGGSGGFAIIDSDALGSGNTQDTDLITPPLDLSDQSAPYIRFNSDWRAVGVGADSADIDVSSDGGASWTNVWHQATSRRGPLVEEVPLFPVAGDSDALVRFRFNGRFAWWWQVDNVQIVNRLCQPVPGGLVVGRTTDANTGAALAGVQVSSVDPPVESGTSAADGFYWLFSSVIGNRQFRATKAGYPPATKDAYVAGDGATQVDFPITAPRIAVSTTSIETFAQIGRSRTATVKITNTGSAPAQVDLLEFPGGFEAMSRQGARLTEVAVPGGARKEQASDGKLPTYAPRASTLIDDAWSRVADFPVPIFDNAAATVDGKIYSVGGGSDTGRERSAYVYDPVAGSWRQLPDMPSARSKPSAAAVNGKLYVFGGWGPDDVVATVDVFDPATGAWSTVPGAVNPTPRAAAGIAVAGGKVYLVAGCVDSTCPDSTDVLAFDPTTGTFTTRAPYPHLVSFQSCGGIGGKVYCAGGASTVSHKDAFVYDPATNRWTALPDLPLDLWGSAHSTASGLLILAGGVTNGFSTITNRSLAFDPSTNAWVDLPATQFPRYRGGGACGTYKIGGSPGGFNSTVETERLGGGLDLCDEIADVPWLSENVTAFTLAAGASRNVTVKVDAHPTLGINQPGAYRAKLGIRTDTPYPVPQVTVTLNVSPPTNWGKVQGSVLGVTCDGEIVAVPATVRFLSIANPDNTYTSRADSTGKYSYWLPRGRYDIVVSKDGWLATSQRLPIEPGVTQTVDVTLEQSCI
ncbi:S8 family serine peptidase [Micromonospora sp. CPCC 206061]|uniref:S8 family serine peptidase n=1 Tax=Micromonospora sp. CPCC 206061 TaxID=3122410 RepID=UPI002FEED2A3